MRFHGYLRLTLLAPRLRSWQFMYINEVNRLGAEYGLDSDDLRFSSIASSQPGRVGRRKPGPPAATLDPGAQVQASAAPKPRPNLLGLLVSPLVELAFRPRHRPAGNGRPLASTWLQALLAMEVPFKKARPTKDQGGNSPPDLTHFLLQGAGSVHAREWTLRCDGYG